MRSEHVSNLHAGWIATGWIVAIAVAAIVHLSLVGTGVVGGGDLVGTAIALSVGFFAGGLFVGLRWSNAPILHGVALTLVSVLVWFAGALLAPEALNERLGGDAAGTLGSLLLQLAASVAGGLTGRRMVLRGQTPDPASIPPEA